MTLVNIRRATRADVPEIMAMVRELAEYERLADQAIATADQFEVALFGPSPAVYAFVVDDDPAAGTLAGFALYFLNFSTWLGVHGIYLEDLYVRPQFRGSGFGKRLLATLAQECVDKGYGRLDWWVLDWNTSSREFYEAQGAQALTEWIPYRVSGDRLPGLAGARD
jgi:GNAT superfamily N-acetyltransferase